MKTLNRILAIVIVALIAASIPVLTASAASVTVDYVGGSDGNNKEGAHGFFGPYFDGEMAKLDATDGLILDLSIADAWFTTEVAPQEMGSHKYAVLEIKTDDPKAIDGFTMKFGGQGKLWQDWTNHDGTALPTLTTSYQTICVDLYASGVDDPDHNITAENNGADIAMNKGEAAGGHIYIKTITFQDEVPAGAAVAGGDGDGDDTPATTEKKDDSTPATTAAPQGGSDLLPGGNTTPSNETSKGDASTGVEGMAIAMAVAAVALGGLVVSKKVK
jgi:hypothetical protein